ncbi:MAG TPA: SIS domain-containing protein [Candidatus Acidoferrales bacterium]|nr:SIS domain-containing protein [Candidatus Acidoferrales bacterium]
MLGRVFEEEICSQPALWARIAASNKAYDLARAVSDRDVVLLGSGSSLFVGQLGALALRRRGIRASALAASEAPFDNGAYKHCAVIALSQSGRSTDLLNALDVLKPSRLVALTNSADSPLAQRADVVIDVEAGPEIAVPASKSVTAMAAILLWTAAIASGKSARNAKTLNQTAEDVSDWLSGDAVAELGEAARHLVSKRSIIVVGTGYGLPVANEIALKFKEASYMHAEGFAAGEFRHGSTALLDPACAVLGIVDDASRATVNKPLADAVQTESLRYVIGGHIGELPLLGPIVDEAFNTLAWLVTGQMLTLMVGRARYVESDAPRGLTKVMI